jgi:hypothetical protein
MKRRLNFSGLHGVLFQTTEIFIVTAVRISDPTRRLDFQKCALKILNKPASIRELCQNVTAYTLCSFL